MKIIVRTCGERTTNKCIELASKQGEVEVINARPFSESIKQTYLTAIKYDQKWIPVIDADVLLSPDTIRQAVRELENRTPQTFCLDGKTDDKIMMKPRRAGIHIYQRSLLEQALQYLDPAHIKPESQIRRMMVNDGYPTYTGKIVFGKHDFEQYYCDLWRKAVVQTRKIAGMLKGRPAKWRQMAKVDKDYLVIYNAHVYGLKYEGDMIIDKEMDFDAEENIKKIGLTEKGPL
jgi:hypothetical protein